MKWLRLLGLILLLLLCGPLLVISCGSINLGNDWRTASRESVGIAPDPSDTSEAVVQVYAARAFNWRGIFGVHTWIATKPANASHYTVHQVLGWRSYHGLPTVVSAPDIPDRLWYGNRPQIIAELRGSDAQTAIEAIVEAVQTYPHSNEYTLWPGPNSNTFTAHVGRQVPALELDLPVTAIGKDYIANGAFMGRAPSGTGYQVSAFGLLGVLAAKREGLEVNLVGLSLGIDPLGPALKLPGFGRLGFDHSKNSDVADR